MNISIALAAISCLLVQAKQPNILFILTDDQDGHMESVEHMQHLQSQIIRKGTSFTHHHCTVSLCCPSRANLWTGRAAHNHNVTHVMPPHSGYPKVIERRINDDYLPLWMQDAGYNTYYAGKLWNFHGVSNYNAPFVRGYNGSDFLLDPFTYRYWDTVMTHNGEPPVSYAGKYNTDVVAAKSYALLDEALAHDEPWFQTVAPIAPHSNWVLDERTNSTYVVPPQSAYRHDHLFHDYKIPRGKSFNTPIEGAPSWIGQLTELNETVLAYNDHYQRQRLRALQAVDEMVYDLVQKLEEAGELENTYIFYTTDNGYHISQHRMHPGKECGYDTDVHIPLFVRGPGLGEGGAVDLVTSHTDPAPTILKLAGVEKQLDGEAIPIVESAETGRRNEHVAVEYWGHGAPEGWYGFRSDTRFETGKHENYYLNNTYKGLRLISSDYSLYFSVWCTSERELFDLQANPEQTINLLSPTQRSKTAAEVLIIAKRPFEAIVPRLNALLMVLKDCKDRSCYRPWETLHPDGSVSSLQEALDPGFDDFYERQPTLAFHRCDAGNFADAETQHAVFPYVDERDFAMESDYGEQWVLAI